MEIKQFEKICLACVLTLLAACSTNSAKKDTYTMPKGGMSSVAHEMPLAESKATTDAEKEKQAKGTKYMPPKQGMSSVGHEMK